MVRQARTVDLEAVEALLAGAALPTDGVASALAELVVIDQDGAVAGAAALERRGSHALLRSVVVAPGARGRGLARALVAERPRARGGARG